MAKLSPSLFAADMLCLERDVQSMLTFPAGPLHVDVMDGHFVDFFGINISTIEAIQSKFPIDMEFHMMVESTRRILDSFLDLNPKKMFVHVEHKPIWKVHEEVMRIRSYNTEPGLAVSPQTDLEAIRIFFPIINNILVMTSMPGTKKSVFLDSSYERIQHIRKLADHVNPQIWITIDGGLDEEKSLKCVGCGADQVVMGRSFFGCDQKDKLLQRVEKCTR